MPSKTVTTEPIEIHWIIVPIVGDSPLIVHKFSEKMRQKMLDKMMKQQAMGRDERNPEEEARECLHFTADGRPGFPATGFKAAMVNAVTQVKGSITKVLVRQAVHVDPLDPTGIIPIEGEWVVREDTVRLPNGVADIRFRPMFLAGWRCNLPIAYNARAISDKIIVDLLQYAGFGVGIGDWRPERGGPFGRFHVLRHDEDEDNGGTPHETAG
jgi:hypothetical protein